jgi:hypothetical protein
VAPVARGWVWVDFENTPHVLFLEPIILRLREAGWEVRITAKPQSHTLELAAARGLPVTAIGAGDLVGGMRKIVGGLKRAAELAAWVGWRDRPRLLVSSSRTAALSAQALGVSTIGLLDYEHAEHRTLARASRSLFLPDLLRDASLPPATRRIARFYAGLKENLYLDSCGLDRQQERRALGVSEDCCFIVARPPATTAHYAAGDGARLWLDAVRALGSRPGVVVLVMPRSAPQSGALEGALAGLPNVRVQREVFPGPGPVAAADLVLGGGGTMNREAAVLGVPVWSLFTGPTPYIDEKLSHEGRLRWVRTGEQLAAALRDEWPHRLPPRGPFAAGLAAILDEIWAVLGDERGGGA